MYRGFTGLLQILSRLSARNRVRWGIAAATLPLIGGLTAFGIAPSTVTEEVAVSDVVENATFTPIVETAADDGYWREERIQRGDTVATLLSRLQVDDANASAFLRTGSEAKGLRRLTPGKLVRAHVAEDGRLIELRFSSGLMVLTVKPYAGSFRIAEEVAPLERRVLVKSAEIGKSLFAAIDAANLSDTIASQLSQIFASDIDFFGDIRSGDRFSVIYEMYFADGEPVQWGRVLAAEFVNSGKAHQAVLFQHPNGRSDYYSPEGASIRKAFLRSPLEYSRISSGFTQARYHPILQLWRAHHGIDYAAAPGTGVKANSDGVVESAGYDRGYGNVIVLRHQQKFTTLYGHLSGFAAGVHRGARVSQGQVIGFVGSTGLATGPHLHYEFRVNSVHQDPLTVAMPEAPAITPELRGQFDLVARPLVERLALLRTTRLARLN